MRQTSLIWVWPSEMRDRILNMCSFGCPLVFYGTKLLIIFLCYINKMKFNLFSLYAVFIPLLIKNKIVLGSRRLSQMIVSVSFGKWKIFLGNIMIYCAWTDEKKIKMFLTFSASGAAYVEQWLDENLEKEDAKGIWWEGFCCFTFFIDASCNHENILHIL